MTTEVKTLARGGNAGLAGILQVVTESVGTFNVPANGGKSEFTVTVPTLELDSQVMGIQNNTGIPDELIQSKWEIAESFGDIQITVTYLNYTAGILAVPTGTYTLVYSK